jgi:hypothetical protein
MERESEGEKREALKIGRILCAGTRGFVAGCTALREDVPAFGALVAALPPVGDGAIYGLVYDVRIEDDPFVRQLAAANLPDEAIRDQRENRLLPIEVAVLAIGCRNGDWVRHCLPAQPPPALEWLRQCEAGEVIAFTAHFDYFRLALEARDAPVDELLAASLRAAALARREAEREAFLVAAGRELARLLAGDPLRLAGMAGGQRHDAAGREIEDTAQGARPSTAETTISAGTFVAPGRTTQEARGVSSALFVCPRAANANSRRW